MATFLRLFVLVFVLSAALVGAAGVASGVLDVQIVIGDGQKAQPVSLQDVTVTNEATAFKIPARTTAEGRLRMELQPGKYVIRTDSPVVRDGKKYAWSKQFEISAGLVNKLTLSQSEAVVTEAETTPKSQPEKPKTEPEKPKTEPEKPKTEPEKPKTEPEKKEPEKKETPTKPITNEQPMKSGRVVSEEARLYQQYKNSVVMVKADGSHGSGFLVDSKGIFITNSHVVHGASRVSVRFGQGEQYPAMVLQDDAVSDVAVLLVNPKLCEGRTPLPLLPAAEVVGIEGEKIIAIGSPLNQERILTMGIISKVETDVLISDININHGNSGGPVLNMAGDVIGIATFGDTPSGGDGPGVSGIVSIRRAASALDKALAIVNTTAPPGMERLPEVSTVKIPSDVLEAGARATSPDPLYLKAPKNFRTYIDSPFTVLSSQLKYEDEVRRKVARRYKNRPMPTTATLGPRAFWLKNVSSFGDAVIRIRVLPWPQETSNSQWTKGLGALIGVRTQRQFELRDDFRRMALYRDGVEVIPFMQMRMFESWAYEDIDIEIDDTAALGFSQYDPEAFAPGGTLELRIWKNDKTEYESVKIDPKVQERLWKPFEPWSKLKKAAG